MEKKKGKRGRRVGRGKTSVGDFNTTDRLGRGPCNSREFTIAFDCSLK